MELKREQVISGRTVFRSGSSTPQVTAADIRGFGQGALSDGARNELAFATGRLLAASPDSIEEFQRYLGVRSRTISLPDAPLREIGDPHLTRHRLHRFLSWCIDSRIPELLTLATTVDAWWPAINAFVLTGITNARTEGYNRLVKTVKRTACGFRNRENSARRIRFHCTRTQRAATHNPR